MYVIDGICYPDNPAPMLTVSEIKALDGYRLWVKFATGEDKTVDFEPMLAYPAFLPLKDEALFRNVGLEYGIPVWMDGEIDISPKALYGMDAI